MGGGTVVPDGFQAAYDALLVSVRGRYPNAYVFITIWSQTKDTTRTALKGVLDAILAAHAADTKNHIHSFSEVGGDRLLRACERRAPQEGRAGARRRDQDRARLVSSVSVFI